VSGLDWLVVAAYLGFALWVGLASREEAGQDAESYFLAGRSAPWCLQFPPSPRPRSPARRRGNGWSWPPTT